MNLNQGNVNSSVVAGIEYYFMVACSVFGDFFLSFLTNWSSRLI